MIWIIKKKSATIKDSPPEGRNPGLSDQVMPTPNFKVDIVFYGSLFLFDFSLFCPILQLGITLQYDHVLFAFFSIFLHTKKL